MDRILVVDDEKKMRHILQLMLGREGFKVEQAENGKVALAMLKEKRFDLVITDLKMPEMDGMSLLDEAKKIDPDFPIMVITAYGTIENAVEAMRKGAIDYITKPFEEEEILITVKRCLRISRLSEEVKVLKEELMKNFDFSDMIAHSKKMLEILRQASMVAKAPDSTVLIQGESGTGKELLARAIHYNSTRSEHRFVAINCAAIPSELIESELFGYEKGAFTGANKRKEGKFEQAHGGTILLDEIGDLGLAAQAKALRVLEQKECDRLGGNEPIKVDVRIIGATNKDLDQLAESNVFRKDLLFRIKVFPLYIPPLRERREDIIPLAEHFLKRFTEAMGKPHPGLSEQAKKFLFKQDWPGNVREVENTIERAVIHSPDGYIDISHLTFPSPGEKEGGAIDSDFVLPPEGVNLEKMERALVQQALEFSQNNQSQAAKLLGLSRGKFRVLVKNITNEDNHEE
ncbi:MAG: sigma-54-dependent Fis family transcriptional regulator [Deltaproteobacteria bacterium]|nr:sigma-54-dependent Fis family transcriptional regulator [Deltaproteobacteria bacterium]